MATAPPLSHFIHEPDPDNPGWCRWQPTESARFIGTVLGKQIVRVDAPDTARVRMFPNMSHTNAGNNVHGGITLAFADVSLFAALYALRGTDAGLAATIDLAAQFVGGGDPSRPLDAVVELLRETRRLAFLRGLIVQDDHIVASFSGTVRKPTAP